MSFRNLSLINQAMLDKVVWKIWIQPDSMMVKILKFKYFKRQTARKGKKSSYLWQSLRWGVKGSFIRAQVGQLGKEIRLNVGKTIGSLGDSFQAFCQQQK